MKNGVFWDVTQKLQKLEMKINRRKCEGYVAVRSDESVLLCTRNNEVAPSVQGRIGTRGIMSQLSGRVSGVTALST
jgi:hypothetical protein